MWRSGHIAESQALRELMNPESMAVGRSGMTLVVPQLALDLGEDAP
jgi:hypothetical protein